MPDDISPITAAPSTRSRGRRRLALAATAVSVGLVVLGAAAVAARTTASPVPVCVAAAVSAACSPQAPLTARERLLTVAGSLTAAPEDHTAGQYEYRHSRTWMLTDTGRSAPRPMTTAVFSRDDHRWVAGDGSGTVTFVEVGPDYTLAGADPAHRSTNTEFNTRKAVTANHPAGELGGSLTGTIPTDPAVLARALDAVDPTRTGPEATIIDVHDLFNTRYVPAAARAAVLRMLAGIPGLDYDERVTDRLGRAGFAVNLDTDTPEAPALRHRLTFDPATGRLLAYQQDLAEDEPELEVPAGQVYLYHLHIDSHRTHSRRAQKPL